MQRDKCDVYYTASDVSGEITRLGEASHVALNGESVFELRLFFLKAEVVRSLDDPAARRVRSPDASAHFASEIKSLVFLLVTSLVFLLVTNKPWPGIHAVAQSKQCTVASSRRMVACRYGNMVHLYRLQYIKYWEGKNIQHVIQPLLRRQQRWRTAQTNMAALVVTPTNMADRSGILNPAPKPKNTLLKINPIFSEELTNTLCISEFITRRTFLLGLGGRGEILRAAITEADEEAINDTTASCCFYHRKKKVPEILDDLYHTPHGRFRRPAASCESPSVAPPGIEPGSPGWKASILTTTPLRRLGLEEGGYMFATKEQTVVITISGLSSLMTFSNTSPVIETRAVIARAATEGAPSDGCKAGPFLCRHAPCIKSRKATSRDGRADRSDTSTKAEPRMKGRGKREIPEKTRRPAASFGTIPPYENTGAAPPGIEHGSPRVGPGLHGGSQMGLQVTLFLFSSFLFVPNQFHCSLQPLCSGPHFRLQLPNFNSYTQARLKLYSTCSSLGRTHIRLERASQNHSIDTHKTPYDRVKRFRERKKKSTKASERVNVDVFTQNKRPSPQHSQTQFYSECEQEIDYSTRASGPGRYFRAGVLVRITGHKNYRDRQRHEIFPTVTVSLKLMTAQAKKKKKNTRCGGERKKDGTLDRGARIGECPHLLISQSRFATELIATLLRLSLCDDSDRGCDHLTALSVAAIDHLLRVAMWALRPVSPTRNKLGASKATLKMKQSLRMSKRRRRLDNKFLPDVKQYESQENVERNEGKIERRQDQTPTSSNKTEDFVSEYKRLSASPEYLSTIHIWATVAERLACSPPTKANRVRSPAGLLPDFRLWESCRTMSLVDGFFRGSPVSPALSFRSCCKPHFTLIGSQDLGVKSRRKPFTHPIHLNLAQLYEVVSTTEKESQKLIKRIIIGLESRSSAENGFYLDGDEMDRGVCLNPIQNCSGSLRFEGIENF
ncbi:hypothetical protein PR048_024678 [Dryococelus australis]|uniref:Uncharacterized protein n=1 Tax=Dryococelus australis TaxID=614101 RepID=A0ABQ9GP78_9NEOP|nr:hypothetical protein PR048_024678 [Dryococelus australis]